MKLDQEEGQEIVIKPHVVEDKPSELDQHTVSSQVNIDVITSVTDNPVITEEAAVDQLPREMHGMTIRDDKVDGHNMKSCYLLLPIF